MLTKKKKLSMWWAGSPFPESFAPNNEWPFSMACNPATLWTIDLCQSISILRSFKWPFRFREAILYVTDTLSASAVSGAATRERKDAKLCLKLPCMTRERQKSSRWVSKGSFTVNKMRKNAINSSTGQGGSRRCEFLHPILYIFDISWVFKKKCLRGVIWVLFWSWSRLWVFITNCLFSQTGCLQLTFNAFTGI